MSNEDLLRRWEIELDAFHQSCRLLRRPPAESLYGLLAAFDSHIITQLLIEDQFGPGNTPMGVLQDMKHRQEGLVWAMRWAHSTSPEAIDLNPRPEGLLLDDGAALIEHGKDYHAISVFHVLYSRGFAKVEIDPDRRIVKFSYEESSDSIEPECGLPEVAKAANDRRASTDQDARLSKAVEFYESIDHRLVNGRVVIADPVLLSSPPAREHGQIAVASHSLFPPETDLLGFSMADLDAFWSALFAWSSCATHVYLKQAAVMHQHECMPTQVVERRQFIDAIAAVAQLDRSVVERIVERLGYPGPHRKADLFLQPLLLGPTTVSWSAYVIQLAKHQRNMLKLMARSPAFKPAADNIIGGRSREFLAKVGSFLAKAGGWSFKLLTELGEGRGDIDLLAYQPKNPTEVLIVEGKAFLEADDIGETCAATEEMIRGQTQAQRVVMALQGIPLEQKRALFKFVDWERVREYFPVVMTPETEPAFNLYDSSEVPGIAFRTIQMRLDRRQLRRPSTLWLAIRDRPWLEEIRKGVQKHRPVRVGSTEYQLPWVDLRPGEGPLPDLIT